MDSVRRTVARAGSHLAAIRNLLVVLGLPLVLLPLIVLVEGQVSRCAYVIIIMAVFWITDVLPIGVTSLIPVFLFPMLGVLEAKAVSASYMNDTSMLFLGGLIFACAIEKWNMHVRVALRVLQLAGSSPRWLMLGLMLVTWFLSMWMSNTATTAMMLPIVQAVLKQLLTTAHAQSVTSVAETTESADHDEVTVVVGESGVGGQAMEGCQVKADVAISEQMETSPTDMTDSREGSTQAADFRRLRVAMFLCVAYSANIGGFATLTGTGPNLVLKGHLDSLYKRFEMASPITFATWMVFALPLSLLALVLLWLWLQLLYLRCNDFCNCITKRDNNGKDDAVTQVIRQQYRALGPMTYAEWTILVAFTCVLVLWITLDFHDVCGWGCLFAQSAVSDSTPVLLVCVLLFVLPSQAPRVFCCSQTADTVRPVAPLLDWRTVHENMAWSLYFLLGGGFAIAKAAEESGLSAWVGSKLEALRGLDPWALLLVLCCIVSFLTEVTSNVALATLILPIVSSLALTLRANPLFFLAPAAISTSLAFCLPVATPPNALVFAGGHVRVIDMVSAGLVLKLVTLPLLVLATVAWGNAFFHLDTLPAGIAAVLNVTANATQA